jgi:predicted transcriptional regulator
MEIVWRLERASAAEIQEALPDPPSYSAVRALLAILVEKGHLKHQQDGRRYVYAPTAKREKAGQGALRRLLSTFFEDSPANLVATLLEQKDRELPPEELERIRSLIDEHAQRRRT